MRRRPLAVQQPRAAEQKGAGANARHPPRAGGLADGEIDRRAIVQRIGDPVAARDAQDVALRTVAEIMRRDD